MQFKRQEGFRFVFNEPIPANFTILNGDTQFNEYPTYTCQILDLSPRGIKIYTEGEIGENKSVPIQLEICFVLDVTTIIAHGKVVWSKTIGQGKQMGIQIIDQPEIVDLIINEMKQRRRKEVLSSRHK